LERRCARCWAERIREVAREVKDGVAAVVFEDEKDFEYCDVKPLLARQAERKRRRSSMEPDRRRTLELMSRDL
jgi:hypothetical protein